MSSTRYDATFLLTQCSTLLSAAAVSKEKLLLFLSVAKRLFELISLAYFTLWLRPFPADVFETKISTDHCIFGCRFRVVRKMWSLESGILILGIPLSRNGPIECAGHVIWRVGRKLRRIARSSLACEAAALAMVADACVCGTVPYAPNCGMENLNIHHSCPQDKHHCWHHSEVLMKTILLLACSLR